MDNYEYLVDSLMEVKHDIFEIQILYVFMDLTLEWK